MMNITNEEFICVTLGVGVVGSIQKFLSKFETLKKFWKKFAIQLPEFGEGGEGQPNFEELKNSYQMLFVIVPKVQRQDAE